MALPAVAPCSLEYPRLTLCLDQLLGTNAWEVHDHFHRLRTQWAVYLIQCANIPLGYRFREYPIGLYCPALDETLECLAHADLAYFRARHSLTPLAVRKLHQIRRLMDQPDGIDLFGWLRLLTALHYLLHIAYVPQDPAGVEASQHGRLREQIQRRAWKGIEYFSRAWGSLDEVGLIRDKVLPCPSEDPPD